jgi:hypothetical protein
MAINLHDYKMVSTPSCFPSAFSWNNAARPSEFLVGGPLICGYTRTFSTSTVNQTPPLLAHSLSSTLAHPLIPVTQILLQWIKLSGVGRRPPKLAPPPAAPRRRTWTQSTPTTTHPSSPSLPAPRRPLRLHRRPPEPRLHPLPGRNLAGDSPET